MPDEPGHLVLVHLRRLDANVVSLREEVADLKGPMTSLETQVGHLLANEQMHYAALMSRLDRFENRLDRIERRTDLVPG